MFLSLAFALGMNSTDQVYYVNVDEHRDWVDPAFWRNNTWGDATGIDTNNRPTVHPHAGTSGAIRATLPWRVKSGEVRRLKTPAAWEWSWAPVGLNTLGPSPAPSISAVGPGEWLITYPDIGGGYLDYSSGHYLEILGTTGDYTPPGLELSMRRADDETELLVTDEHLDEVAPYSRVERYLLPMRVNQDTTEVFSGQADSRGPYEFADRPLRGNGALPWIVEKHNRLLVEHGKIVGVWVLLRDNSTEDDRRQVAQYLKANLHPLIQVIVEFSNEVWNEVQDFAQTFFVEFKGFVDRLGQTDPSDTTNPAPADYNDVRAWIGGVAHDAGDFVIYYNNLYVANTSVAADVPPPNSAGDANWTAVQNRTLARDRQYAREVKRTAEIFAEVYGPAARRKRYWIANASISVADINSGSSLERMTFEDVHLLTDFWAIAPYYGAGVFDFSQAPDSVKLATPGPARVAAALLALQGPFTLGKSWSLLDAMEVVEQAVTRLATFNASFAATPGFLPIFLAFYECGQHMRAVGWTGQGDPGNAANQALAADFMAAQNDPAMRTIQRDYYLMLKERVPLGSVVVPFQRNAGSGVTLTSAILQNFGHGYYTGDVSSQRIAGLLDFEAEAFGLTFDPAEPSLSEDAAVGSLIATLGNVHTRPVLLDDADGAAVLLSTSFLELENGAPLQLESGEALALEDAEYELHTARELDYETDGPSFTLDVSGNELEVPVEDVVEGPGGAGVGLGIGTGQLSLGIGLS